MRISLARDFIVAAFVQLMAEKANDGGRRKLSEGQLDNAAATFTSARYHFHNPLEI